MCTVTFLPGTDTNFSLVSSRDEDPNRGEVTFPIHENQLWFPKDQKGGGTWIAVHPTGRLACVLNGAATKHERHPPYRMSRGKMLLAYFTYPNAEAFVQNFDFEGIEPFTLIIVEPGPYKPEVFQLRWNELRTELVRMDSSQKHIWSSATLYNDEQVQERAGWFSQWFENRDTNWVQDYDFHKTRGDQDPYYSIVMEREGVRTTSVTAVAVENEEITLRYDNFASVQEKKLTKDEVENPKMA